jgi:succinate dehydrogenase / fumarate reductase, cytochrome b subunit
MPRTVCQTNPAAALWSTMVGKKVVMAVTGFVLVGFVVGHMLAT